MDYRTLLHRLSLPFVAILILASPVVQAQTDPVRLKLTQPLPRSRSVSPIPIEIKLEYNQQQILQGSLTLSVYDDRIHRDALRGTVVFEDLTLSGSDLILEALLPPFGPAWSRQLLIEAEFETSDGDVILLSNNARPDAPREPFSLLIDQQSQRTMSVAVCTRELQALKSANRRFLENEITPLRFEPEVPGGRQNDGRRLDVITFPVTPITLSDNPAAYCAYDVLIITDQSLGLLEESHLTAIEAWVGAGGSALVVADGRVLPQQLGFLQRLMTDESGSTPPLTLTDGIGVANTGSNRPLLLANHGLGAAALISETGSLQQSLTQLEINQLAAHLFKFRSTQPVFNGEPWTWSANGRVAYQSGQVFVQNGYVYRITPSGAQEVIGVADGNNGDVAQVFLNPQTNSITNVAKRMLLPDDVEMIEPWAIALILLAYVVVIGPVDYFVLGWLKLRKFTWIAFPVTTMAFTAFTIWMANYYLGSNDTGQSLTFTDIGPGGRVLRQSSLQMMFYGAETLHTEQVSGALVSQVQSFDGSGMGDPYRSGEAIQLSEPASFEGRYPNNYRLTQRVGQWSPQLLRTLRIAPDDVTPPDLPWDDCALWTTDTGRQQLGRQIRAAFPDDTRILEAVVMNGGATMSLLQTGSNLNGIVNPAVYNNWNQYGGQRSVRDSELLAAAIAAGTSGERQQFFGLFEQISPQGSGYMEDLVLFDADDRHQWLLLIAVQQGDEFHVYRRRYREPTADVAGREE